MKKLTVYGIKNCDTMKKAFQWLERHKVAYDFHDYKKEGADAKTLTRAIKQHGWENVLNRKGTTWRALSERVKEGMTDKQALKTALENPSVIRRPMIVQGSQISFGYDEDEFKSLYKK